MSLKQDNGCLCRLSCVLKYTKTQQTPSMQSVLYRETGVCSCESAYENKDDDL